MLKMMLGILGAALIAGLGALALVFIPLPMVNLIVAVAAWLGALWLLGQSILVFPRKLPVNDLVAQQKLLVFQKLNWVVFGIGLVGAGLVFFFGLTFPANFIGWLVTTAVGCLVVYFSWSPMIPACAELGWWQVQVPENSAAILEYLGACWKIVINCNDPNRRRHFELLAAWRNQQAGYEMYVVLSPGDGYYFFGLFKWPWQYKMRDPWYERPEDETNPTIEPVRFCFLKERPWDIIPDNVATADPIEVEAKLYVRASVWDPYSAVYGSQFPGESVCHEIASTWRLVIQTMRYIARRTEDRTGDLEGLGAELDLNPDIQGQVYDQLHKILGLSDGNPKIVWARNQIFVQNNFPEKTPAWVCLSTVGFQILEIKVQDLQPADPEIRKDFERKTAAMAAAAAKFAEAKGDAIAEEERARGDAAALTLRADAMKDPDARLAFQTNAAVQMANAVGNVTVVSGGGGASDTANMVSVLGAMGGIPMAQAKDPGAKKADPPVEEDEPEVVKPQHPEKK
ncbi:MAG: SPFH domain-containing protein [Candidatus Buchananbacteria bacterium]